MKSLSLLFVLAFSIPLLVFIAPTNSCAAEPLNPPMSLEVTADRLFVRDRPPWFSWKTLFTFQYVLNPPVSVLKMGARIVSTEEEVIGNGQRWYKISFEDEDNIVEGWIYVGNGQELINVKEVSEVEEEDAVSIHIKQVYEKSLAWQVLQIFISKANASDPAESPNSDPKTLKAPVEQVLIVQLFYVVIFIISFITIHKFTNDKWLTSLGALGVLLICGFISQSTFVDLTARLMS